MSDGDSGQGRGSRWKLLLLSAGATALCCALEPILRSGGALASGLLLAVVLGGAVGGLLSLLALRLPRYRLAATVLLLPAPLLPLGTIRWSIERAAELSWAFRSVGVWFAALTIAAIIVRIWLSFSKKHELGQFMRVRPFA